MQKSCQMFSPCKIIQLIALLLAIWFPLSIFMPRYSVIVLSLCAVLIIFAALKHIKSSLLSQEDVIIFKKTMHKNLIKISKGNSKLELTLNIGLLGLSCSSLYTSFGSQAVETRIMGLMIASMGWWYGFHYMNHRFDFSKHLKSAMLIGILVSMLGLMIEAYLGHPWLKFASRQIDSQYSKIALLYAIAIWPLIQDLKPSLKILTLFALGGFIFTNLDCDTAVLALMIGGFGYGFGAIAKHQFFYRALQGLVVILTLTTPYLTKTYLTQDQLLKFCQTLPPSYVHRLYIYHDVTEQIFKNPLLGHGLNASYHQDIGKKPLTIVVTSQKNNTPFIINTKTIHTHPHNMILQWWLEWGAIGALWWAFTWVAWIERIRHIQNNQRRATAMAMMAVGTITVLMSIGFWETWWWACLFILLPFIKTSTTEKGNLCIQTTKFPCM